MPARAVRALRLEPKLLEAILVASRARDELKTRSSKHKLSFDLGSDDMKIIQDCIIMPLLGVIQCLTQIR